MGDANLSGSIKKIFFKIVSAVFMKKRIVFESSPEFSCNTYPVYKYLTDSKNLAEKAKIVWLVQDRDKYRGCNLPNHKFFEYTGPESTAFQKFRYLWLLSTSKVLVYSNRLLGKYSGRQYSICLMHGMPLKSTQNVYRIDNHCDNVICMSDFFEENIINGFGADKDKLLNLDFARNDYLFSDRDIPSILDYKKYDKVIAWLPTYRQHTRLTQYDMNKTATGLSVLTDTQSLRIADDWLSRNNCLLIIKPHPVQAEELGSLQCKNIRILTNEDLARHDVQTNEFLGKTDALITDYSTVYYDYLLTGKQIGLTCDDLGEYTEKRGFFYENIYDVLKGVHISTTEDMLSFFDDLKNGVDKTQQEREEISKKIHPYYKGNTSGIIGDIIYKNLFN